ncbi:molybdenum-pterin-binding protein [Campylobacter sp. RM10532]|uniref:TOBE domain-containing protein n=1 Tax=Campylobacter molothri TaxID=1032242 RepID=UPI00301E3CF1|nr:molybdenum-pterin-binding protein [Campylobacter sp. RM10542]MBZ7945007.1 molybdenum-pterin-binding protein [Campylobacter sp. RM10532]
MNILKGKVCDLIYQDDLILVKINCEDEIFQVLMLSPFKELKLDQEIQMLFKEHELCFATLNSSLSVENSFKAKISKIKEGKLLYHVFFKFHDQKISSLITKEKALELKLCQNQEWLCFIKSNDIILRTDYA